MTYEELTQYDMPIAKAKGDSYGELYEKAHQAGLKALNETVPKPMTVGTPKDIFSREIDYSKPVYHVPEGLCGFAWIVIKPATSGFAKWLKAKGYARKHYYGGISVWVSEGGQSYERKQAYASAFARVLTEAGFNAWAESRLD